MTRNALIACAIMTALGIGGGTASGQMHEVAHLLPSDGASADRFGSSVSLSGDTVVVGAYRDDDNGEGSGSAYVFVRDQGEWIEQTKLLPSDGAGGDFFGVSVALLGDTIVVGANGNDDNGLQSGSTYVFVRHGTAWTQQAKLLPLDGAANDRFGRSVSLSGDTVVVGAYRDDDNGEDSGSAYVFVRNGSEWTQQAKLLPSDGASADRFGSSVSLSGDTVVVGAYRDDDNGEDSGSAYVFVRGGSDWTQQAKLLPLDGAAYDYFGWSVTLSGDTAVVGAHWDDDNGSFSGSAYVFVRDGTEWTQQGKLLASDGAVSGEFGYSLSCSGDMMVVGAQGAGDGHSIGAAYVFVRDGTEWTQQGKLLASDGLWDDLLGASVSLSGDTAVVGAPQSFEDNSDLNGSAYVFDLRACAADVDGSSEVEFADILILLATWGPCDECPADVDLDGVVGFDDLLIMLTAWGPCPQPGACCLPNGSCVLSASGGTTCASQGGVYHGDDTLCADVYCPSGACCLPNGSCEQSNVGGAVCEAAGGVYHGDDTLCADVVCPQPGACCITSGFCVQWSVGGALCEATGGVYHGDDTLCADVVCPQPGACCLPNGSCAQSAVGGNACASQGGVYQGDDTLCADVVCPFPGACCMVDGSCEQAIFLGGGDCASQGGVYHGDDTSCATTACGACCLADHTCDIGPEEACLAAGGSFVGEGTICNIDCTKGACCLPDGSCMFVELVVCDILAGDYQGNGIPCESISCP